MTGSKKKRQKTLGCCNGLSRVINLYGDKSVIRNFNKNVAKTINKDVFWDVIEDPFSLSLF